MDRGLELLAAAREELTIGLEMINAIDLQVVLSMSIYASIPVASLAVGGWWRRSMALAR